MSQHARPTADAFLGAWTGPDGGTTNIFTLIDEESPNDTDFIQSEAFPVQSPVVFRLSAVDNPLVKTGHVCNFRYRKASLAVNTWYLTVELYQDYVDEGNPGTLISQHVYSDIVNQFVNGSFELSLLEAALITDYSNLYIRLMADQ